MRIVHFTDIHVRRAPSLRELASKRLLGNANLYLAGRIRHFEERVVRALVQAILQLDPDLVVCTGDLTAAGLDSEFEAARGLLGPLTDRFPFILVPGNHDTYTRRAHRARRLESWFGAHTGDGAYPTLHVHGPLAFVGLDPCISHPLLSHGTLPEAQVEALDAMLEHEPRLDGRFTTLLVHYPLRGGDGHPYRPRSRALTNAAALETVLRAHPRRVELILHGHHHHPISTRLETPAGSIPILNPGAGGYALRPEQGATGRFQLLELGSEGLGKVQRFAWNGEGFREERITDAPPPDAAPPPRDRNR